MPQTVEDKIVARIYGNGRGWAFSPIDFSGLASRNAIHLVLHRLENRSIIRRVMRGIYDYPRYSDLLEQSVAPDLNQIAQALARKFGWRIQPGGATAQNLLGLSTQVPSHYIYQSDGPNRSYVIGQVTLEFKHVALKEAGFRHDASGVIVQALKAMGQEQVTDQVIERIRAWLPAVKRSAVLKDTKRVTDWVYAALRQICREDGDG